MTVGAGEVLIVLLVAFFLFSNSPKLSRNLVNFVKKLKKEIKK